MNWVKLVLIVVIIGVFLALFGSTIGDTIAEIDFTLLNDPISVMGEIINGFIITFDTASATFPLTIQTILLVAGLGIAGYVVRRVIKSE
jgi:hypothetical protein